MFVRTKLLRNKDGSTRTYLQIVKGERVGGKVRQRVVANLGRLKHLEKGGLDRLVEGLARFSRYQLVKDKARKLEARWAKTWGPALVFRRLWEELGLEAVLEGLLEERAVVSDYEEAVFAMVLNPGCSICTGPWTSWRSTRPRSRGSFMSGRRTCSASRSTSCCGM
jgi:hypothetical protein